MRAKSNSLWKFLEEMRGWRTQKHTFPYISLTDQRGSMPYPHLRQILQNYTRKDILPMVAFSETEIRRKRGKANWRLNCDGINRGSDKLAELLARFKQQDWTVLLSCRQNLRSKHKQLWQKERMPSTTRLTPWKAWPYARMRRRTHVRRAAMNRSRSVIVKANDTNVVVIAISTFTHIAELGLTKMWIAFGQAVHTRRIPVPEIISVIEPEYWWHWLV